MAKRQFDLNIVVSAKDAASGVIGGVSSNLQKLGTLALSGIGAGAAAIVAYGTHATLTAARVSEMRAVLDLLGERAGWSAIEIQSNIEAMTDLGIRTDVAQDTLAQFARNQLDAADATMAARVAQDLAVLSGRDSSETLDELIYGIQTQNGSLQVFRDLGIQTGAVLDNFAESLGKEAKELSKAERMQAMLNATQEAGADVFGVYETAMKEPGKMLRSLPRHFYEIAVTVGNYFLPALGSGVDIVTDLVTSFRGMLEEGQPLGDFLAKIGDFLNTHVVAGFSALSDVAGKLMDVFTANGNSAATLFTVFEDGSSYIGWVLERFGMASEQAERFGQIIANILGPVVAWVEENVSLNDVLVGLGVAIASVVLPVIGSLLSTIAPIIAVFAGVVLAVALLRQAWENDFLGIRTIFENVWNNGIKPAFEYVRAELIPRVIEIFDRLREMFTTKLLPILDRLGLKIEGSVGPQITDVLILMIGQAVVGLENFITVIEKMLPFLDLWLSGIGVVADKFIAMRDAIRKVSSAVSNLNLPSWLTPGSPTPLELGLDGINSAMDDLAKKHLPSLSGSLGIASPLQPAMAGAGASGGSYGREQVKIVVPITMNGREVGYGAVEGTLDAFRQRGMYLESETE
jgi:hypothetical protein